jgi:putative permease
MNLITSWFRRHLSDPQVVILVVVIVITSTVIIFFGKMLAPLLASVVIAYLLQGPVGALERRKIPRLLAVVLVFVTFIVFLLLLILGLLPLLWQQVEQLFNQLPSMIAWSQETLLRLPERYPDFVSEKQVIDIIDVLRSEVTKLGQQVLSLSLASVRALIVILVYIFLVPLLVFFLLKDKEAMLGWVGGFLPEDRAMVTEVWREVNLQIGNYIRGKAVEIMIVWLVSYATFTVLGLQYAMLLGFFVGLSVLIPYIGATVMTLPVASIAYFQWGWSSHFGYVVGAYIIIQILDGNVLVALLFSEVVNLHPVAIIVSVLVFGGMFGFWGVFFAIPLATLVQAILRAWFTRTLPKETAQTATQDLPNEVSLQSEASK